MKDYQLLQQQYSVPTYGNRGITLVSGEGVYLRDVNDRPYLDFMTNYGVNLFGHCHPQIVAALSEQLRRLTTLHGSFSNDVRAQASMELVRRCGPPYARVYWSNSGSESVEAALKFAVLATGKRRFVACRGGYHGKTLGSLAITSGEKYRKNFEPLLWDVEFVKFNDLPSLQSAIDKPTAAFVMEPIQGESGVILPDPGYLASVAEICRRANTLLILDEVQSGAARTGTFLASQAEGVTADIVCLGKGLAGGIPVGATVVTETVGSAIPRHIHTSTFGGNPLACSGVVSVLRLLDEQRLLHIQSMGKLLLEGMQNLSSPVVHQARGRGLMLGLHVTGHRDLLLKEMQDRGLLAVPAGEDVVRFLPPFIVESDHARQALQILREILGRLV